MVTQPRRSAGHALGLIGLGRIGTLHAETLAGLKQVDSVVVTDAIPAAVDRAVEAFGFDAVGSPQALLAAGVDGVVVASSTDTHPGLLVAAIEAGLPVLCEKPVALRAGDGVAVAELAERTSARVQIGYNRRFDAAFAAARLAVASGVLGRLHTVRSTTMDPAPPPAAYVERSGGIFRDCSVHDFDIIRFVTGREVVEVYATGSTRGDAVFAANGDVATSAAVLTLDDDTLVVVTNTRYNSAGYDVRLELHGSADTVAVGGDDRLPVRSLEPGVGFPAGPRHDFFLDRFSAAYRAEMIAFTELVADTSPSQCTVADALEAGWIAEACTASLHEHRPVRLSELRPDAPVPEVTPGPGRTPFLS